MFKTCTLREQFFAPKENLFMFSVTFVPLFKLYLDFSLFSVFITFSRIEFTVKIIFKWTISNSSQRTMQFCVLHITLYCKLIQCRANWRVTIHPNLKQKIWYLIWVTFLENRVLNLVSNHRRNISKLISGCNENWQFYGIRCGCPERIRSIV